jgi:hypothetical protein
MSIPNTTYRVLVEKLGNSNASQFIGNEGEVFYNPNTPTLKLSDGQTPGGVPFGGNANTGNITFSEERIIGAANQDYPLGVIQITPSLNNQSFGSFVDNGQFVNVYPTIGDDAPHIHITAGFLSTTSPYYNPPTNYIKGDLFLGDDDNYVGIYGNGEIRINSAPSNGSIILDGANSLDGKIRLYQNGNVIDVRTNGLEFRQNVTIAKPDFAYVGQGTTNGGIYNSQMYGANIGSMKVLIQCMGDGGGVQLSEMLIAKKPNTTNVYLHETDRVSDRNANNHHCEFTARYNTNNDVIEIVVNTTSSPDTGGWSFVIQATEFQRYID